MKARNGKVGREVVLTHKEQQLLEALEPRANAEGVEIVTLEIVGAKKAPTIRVYIDTPDGVSFDELSSTQAWMGDLMDEIDPPTRLRSRLPASIAPCVRLVISSVSREKTAW